MKGRYAKGSALLLLLLLFIFSFAGKALAADINNYLPRQADFTGSNPEIVVSRSYDGNSLDAPTARVKLYSTDRSPTLTIHDFGHCSVSMGGSDSETYSQTTYDIYGLQSDRPGANARPDAERPNGHNCTDQDVPLHNPYDEVSIGNQQFYEWRLDATISGDGVNGFSLSLSSGYIGYSNDAPDKFALQNRAGAANGLTQFNIPFGTNCSINSETSAPLKWYDDDWNNLQSNSISPNFGFSIIDDSTGRAVTLYNNAGTPGRFLDDSHTKFQPHVGSDRDPGAFNHGYGLMYFDAEPNGKYTWQWDQVANDNGIQFNIPYDTIFHKVQCQQWTLNGNSQIQDAPGSSNWVGAGGGYTRDNPIVVTPDSRGSIPSIKMRHDVNNNGPSNASYNWKIEGNYNPNDGSGWTGYGPYHVGSNADNGANACSGPLDSGSPNNVAQGTDHPDNDTCAYQFPSGARDGAMYCQHIEYTNANGPNGTTGDSDEVCVQLSRSHAPTGTVTCNMISSSAGTVSATFNDPDGSARYPLTGTLTGTPIPYQVTVNANHGTIPRNGGTINFTLPAGTTSVTFTLTVPDVGPNPGAALVKTATCGAGCATLTNPSVTVTLSDSTPRGGTLQSYGFGSVTVNQSENYYDVNSVFDNSPNVWGGRSVPLHYTHTRGSNTVTIDYSPYATDYPYDNNQAAVSYDTRYDALTYSYTGPAVYNDYYTCNGNDSLSNFICTPADGGRRYGATHHHDLLGYQPVLANRTNGLTASSTAYGTQMNPICARTFTVTGVNVTAGLDDYEDPQTGSSAATANVTFGYTSTPPAMGVRQRMKVNLSYTDVFTSGCNSATSGGTGFTVLGDYGAGTVSNAPVGNNSCRATAPPLSPGDTICAQYTVVPAGTQMDVNGNVTNASGTQSGSGCSAPLHNSPYAHFMGQDVSAGGAFDQYDNQCATAAAAPSGIEAFVKGAGPLTRGTSAQFGAQALGSVANNPANQEGFGTASLRSSLPTALSGLTFANSPSGTLGNLGVTSHCIPDFFATKDNSTTLSGGNSLNLAPYNAPGTKTATQLLYGSGPGSQITINGFNGIGDGNYLAVYVNGDVYIRNNIKFKNTSWPGPSDVPSFYLIVKGNIYIDPGVTQLDGVYVAQPDGGSGGTINTCADGFDSYGHANASGMFTPCNNQLTVNGAFIAQKVNLDRTYASLRNSVGGEYPATPAINCTLGDQNVAPRPLTATDYDCAAEVFNFSPEVYLGTPGINPTASSRDGTFDYITSLSPVL